DGWAVEGLGSGAGNQREGGKAEAPDRADEYGIVGGGGIEILAGWPSLFGENLRYVEVVWRIADRHGDDPFAGPGFVREVGDAVLAVFVRGRRPGRRVRTSSPLPAPS